MEGGGNIAPPHRTLTMSFYLFNITRGLNGFWVSRNNTKTFTAGQNTLYPSVNYLSEQSLTKCYRTALLHLWGILQPLSKHEIIFRADCRASCQALHSSSISTSILILTAIQYLGEGRNFDNQTACQ